ncbi:helicase [Arthrobacter sp. MYb229]|uniref:DEAD/DEAH box helicase n=1 Tax=Micrococcaceae TaxID=1268 RepID=UPI000CFCB496|nr:MULTISPECIES: DEAD/DEAH box helicase [unclassified Arthrobacter]PRA05967.1 helicase [Arthrobacter sp. MYb229]PRB52869.1 helicase [Arthrobacter sp. MYb216]
MKSVRALLDPFNRQNDPEAVIHRRSVAAKDEITAPWPTWIHDAVRQTFEELGIQRPWLHQVQAAESVHAGNHTIISTGTASGKSLAYLMPSIDLLYRTRETGPNDAEAQGTILYICPTKALAADQLASVQALKVPGVRASSYDGDTDQGTRSWVRQHANFVFTNPDMLHRGILSNHQAWSRFFKRLRYVVIDEAHSYRGVFGAHVANLMRRLRRICAHYGNDPVFIGASATSSDPEESFSRLIGAPAQAVTHDFSASGELVIGLWEPPLTDRTGENGAPLRRTAIAESASILTDLMADHVRSIVFIKSRRGAETIAALTRKHLEKFAPELSVRLAAYRSGYLPAERREVEKQLRSGQLLGVTSTSALELGIDIAGLDAVVVAGWPGTRASFFQQIGRAGRSGQDALAIFVAAEDPLDTYLVHHPEAIFELGVEATVFDPHNKYVLSGHLCAAAQEHPLRPEELALFGPQTEELLDSLVQRGYLRRRPAGWFWTHPQHAASMFSIRADGGGPVDIIDAETGALLGTMDSPQTHYQAHPGAIYVHQGASYHVEELDEQNHVVVVSRVNPDYYTNARDLTTVEVHSQERSSKHQELGIFFGEVTVTTQVVSFQRKSVASNEVLSEEPLELEARELHTKSVWFTLTEQRLLGAGLTVDQFPGALHAAEHAMIGLLPLVATSDRWDIGGVSTALHMDTGHPSIFVYDAQPGGAGFAERGFERFLDWVRATRDAIQSCECAHGCPSCVQSPKCGNRNNPLDKSGAILLLSTVLQDIVPAHHR